MLIKSHKSSIQKGRVSGVQENTYSLGRDVRKIGGNTGGVDNIVEGKLVNVWAGLQEEREGAKGKVSFKRS